MLSKAPHVELILAALLAFFASSSAIAATPAEVQSSKEAIAYLANVMDQFHERFWIYDDLGSPGNHFHAWARFAGGGASATMVGSETDTVYSGATSIRCEMTYLSPTDFAGFNMQNGILPAGTTAPQANYGTVPNAGITELAGATRLVFSAKGQKGGERIKFHMAGVGWNEGFHYKDSSDSIYLSSSPIELTANWETYAISLEAYDLSYVLGGFGWGASALDDADGDGSVVFYIDEMYFELNDGARTSRLSQPRFLRSFTTESHQSTPDTGDFDFVLRNTAFTYDNALALLAFLADGSADSLRRAELLADAFVYTLDHDREFNGDRLRDAYSAGDIALPPGWTPNNRIATIPVSGFYDVESEEFFEVFQETISTGNNAWAIVALLGAYRSLHKSSYLDAAQRIANYIESYRQATGAYQGYLGGWVSAGSGLDEIVWASTEHNIDLVSAFTLLHEITGEGYWLDRADHAGSFVHAMWSDEKKGFLAGTSNPDERNAGQHQFPLDTQSWSVLAIRDLSGSQRSSALGSAEANHLTQTNGFLGFDFNNDKDGVWFEGTAQMAVAYKVANLYDKAAIYTSQLRKAQETAPYGDHGGISAAAIHGLTTGFDDINTGQPFHLYRRLHVGATSWFVFAQLGYNPYYQTFAERTAVDEHWIEY